MNRDDFLSDSASMRGHLMALLAYSRACSSIGLKGVEGMQRALMDVESTDRRLHATYAEAKRDVAKAEAGALDEAHGRLERAKKNVAVGHDCLQRLVAETTLFNGQVTVFHRQMKAGIPAAAEAVFDGLDAIMAAHVEPGEDLDDLEDEALFIDEGPDEDDESLETPFEERKFRIAADLVPALDDAVEMHNQEFDNLWAVIDRLRETREQFASSWEAARPDWPDNGGEDYENHQYAFLDRASLEFERALERLASEIDAVMRDLP